MRKGFTLIELLAVIVILGIILTLAVMKVSDFIEDSEKEALIKEADSILDTVRYQISSGDNLLDEYNIKNSEFVEENSFSYSGKLPESGRILVRDTDELSIAISDGYWCVNKSYMSNSYDIYESKGSCTPGLNISSDSEMAKCFTFVYFGGSGYGNPKGIYIKNYICSDRNVIIPTTYNNQAVVGISKMGCTECMDKLDMSFATNVTYIEPDAFENAGLEEVILSSNLEIICYDAFKSNNLTNIIIPASVKEISSRAFENNKLVTMSFLGEKPNIWYNAFRNNLFSGDDAFILGSDGTLVAYGGPIKKDIVIPNTVTSIGHHAFYELNIESVTIPNTVTSIGFEAFSYNSLTSVTIPASVLEIGKAAFYKYSNSNIGLNSIIYKGTTLQFWEDIINSGSGASFLTGTVVNSYGNVTISAN